MKRIVCVLLANFVFFFSYGQKETAKGEHYLFPAFNQGVVLLKGGKMDAKMLNYNMLTEQLLFDSYGKILAVPDEQLARVDTVFIQERRFIILNDQFVELIHHSKWDLFAEHKCDLKEQGKDAGYGGKSQTSAINNPSSVRLGGMVYNLQLPDGFEIKRYAYYWLRKDGEVKQLANMKQLKKLYKQKDDLLDDYVKKNEVKFEDHETIIKLISYLESQ